MKIIEQEYLNKVFIGKHLNLEDIFCELCYTNKKNVMIRPCEHRACKECLDNWLKKN